MGRLFTGVNYKFEVSGWLLGVVLLFVFCMPCRSKAQGNQTVPNGANITATDLSSGGCVYKWTNSDPSIGLPASGTGDIAAFKAVNTGTKPKTATITATPEVSGFAFIPSITDNVVAVINTATNSVVSYIKAGDGSFGVCVSPDGKTVYISNGVAGTISAINVATNSIIDTRPVGTTPRGIAVSPDGSKVYIANLGSNNITVYNTITKALKNIAVGKGPIGVIFSPDGQRVYVTNNYDGTVSVIGASADMVIATIKVGTTPFGMAMDPLGKLLYVADPASNDISVVDLQKLNVKGTIPANGNSEQVTISPDGKLLYISNSNDYLITVLTIADNSTISIPTGDGPAGMSLSPNGAFLYVVNKYSNDVSVINTTTTFVDATIPVGKFPYALGNFVTGKASCTQVTFTITVNPDPSNARISSSGTLAAVNTTYGTPSASTSIHISGTEMAGGILVTPPKGFEVSADDVNFTNTLTIGAAGKIDPTAIYLRLKATAPVSIYGGAVVLTSEGAPTIRIDSVVSEVTKAPLTILADPASKVYGSTLINATASPAFSAVGLMNDETIATVTLAYGTGADALAKPDTYSGQVVPSLATGGSFAITNYDITYKANDIVVTPAMLTVTADDKSKFLDDNNPLLTCTYSGFVNNDSAAQLLGLPVISTTALKNSPVGTYPITISGALTNNYNINYIPGTLTVLSKAIAVPNTFTPNGDGVNDTWDIQFLSAFPNCRVEIFDRYGSRIFLSVGYAIAWDGKLNGTNIPVGTYYYIIDLNNNAKPLAGYVAVLR